MDEKRKNKQILTIVFLTVFLDLVGFGIVLPLMPVYATLPEFMATSLQIGLLMASYSLMQFFFAPVWGKLSDQVGRKPILILGLFGSAIAHLLYGLAESLTVLFIARILAGIAGANIATAQAVIADVLPPEKRAAGMGLIGAAFGLGFVVGPALGGFLSSDMLGNHHQLAPLCAALLCFINAVAAIFFLKETRKVDSKRWVVPFSLSPWKTAMAQPGVPLILSLGLILITGFAAFEIALPLYGKYAYDWTLTSIGYVFAYIGILITLVQGGMVRRMVPRYGEVRMILVGFVLLVFSLVVMAMGVSSTVLLLALIPMTMGFGLLSPSLSSLLSRITHQDHQGTVLGLYQSMNSLGRVVGPSMGGFFFAVTASGLQGPTVPFAISAGLLSIAFFMAFILYNTHRHMQGDVSS